MRRAGDSHATDTLAIYIGGALATFDRQTFTNVSDSTPITITCGYRSKLQTTLMYTRR